MLYDQKKNRNNDTKYYSIIINLNTLIYVTILIKVYNFKARSQY